LKLLRSIAGNGMIGLMVRRPGPSDRGADLTKSNECHLPREATVMSTTTPVETTAQDAGPNKPGRRFRIRASLPADSPERIAARKRRIRIARAVNLICRTKCPCTVAARACGLDGDSKALQDIRDLLDFRHIPRRRKGAFATPSRIFEEFIPRQDGAPAHHLPPSPRDLAEMVAELIAVADPLGDDAPRADRARDAQVHVLDKKAAEPKPPRICASCGGAFEGNRGAKFCSGKCRIKNWRGQR
jgi:hypothetical protein